MSYYIHAAKRTHQVGGSDELPIDRENERRIAWTISSDAASFSRFQIYKPTGQFDLVDLQYKHEDGQTSFVEAKARQTKDKSGRSYDPMIMAYRKMMGLVAASVDHKNGGGTMKHLLYVWGWPRETFLFNLCDPKSMEFLGTEPPQKLPASERTKGKYGEHEYGYMIPKSLCQRVVHKEHPPWENRDDLFFEDWQFKV